MGEVSAAGEGNNCCCNGPRRAPPTARRHPAQRQSRHNARPFGRRQGISCAAACRRQTVSTYRFLRGNWHVAEGERLAGTQDNQCISANPAHTCCALLHARSSSALRLRVASSIACVSAAACFAASSYRRNGLGAENPAGTLAGSRR